MDEDLSDSQRLADSAIGLAISNQEKDIPQELEDWNQLIPSDFESWQSLMGFRGGEAVGLLIPFSEAPGFTHLGEPRIVLTPSGDSEYKGRLFIGVIFRGDGDIDFEFISWNRKRGEFDFGIIKHFGVPDKQEIEFPNPQTCHSCHKNRAPIFPRSPWDNSVINRAVLASFTEGLSKSNPEEV